VFKLLDIDGALLEPTRRLVGPIVSTIGEEAGVIVDERTKRIKAKGDKPAHDVAVRKFASAHDLRRAFGVRWAGKVMPTVLRELMRHEDIGTTMKFYVGQNAEKTAEAVWAVVGNIQGNTRQPARSDCAKTP
jgi:integrase